LASDGCLSIEMGDEAGFAFLPNPVFQYSLGQELITSTGTRKGAAVWWRLFLPIHGMLAYNDAGEVLMDGGI